MPMKPAAVIVRQRFERLLHECLVDRIIQGKLRTRYTIMKRSWRSVQCQTNDDDGNRSSDASNPAARSLLTVLITRCNVHPSTTGMSVYNNPQVCRGDCRDEASAVSVKKDSPAKGPCDAAECLHINETRPPRRGRCSRVLLHQVSGGLLLGARARPTTRSVVIGDGSCGYDTIAAALIPLTILGRRVPMSKPLKTQKSKARGSCQCYKNLENVAWASVVTNPALSVPLLFGRDAARWTLHDLVCWRGAHAICFVIPLMPHAGTYVADTLGNHSTGHFATLFSHSCSQTPAR